MMKLTVALEKAGVADRVKAGLEKLAPAGGNKTADEIWYILNTKWMFVVNGRPTRRSGQCRYPYSKNPKGFVEIHQCLLKPEHKENRNKTILHEVAHAVNPLIYGYNDKHGRNWKRIMIAFGCEPKRTCTLEVSKELQSLRQKKAKLVYACQSCEHEFPVQRKKKHPAHIYYHKRCGGRLYLKIDANKHINPNPSKVA